MPLCWYIANSGSASQVSHPNLISIPWRSLDGFKSESISTHKFDLSLTKTPLSPPFLKTVTSSWCKLTPLQEGQTKTPSVILISLFISSPYCSSNQIIFVPCHNWHSLPLLAQFAKPSGKTAQPLEKRLSLSYRAAPLQYHPVPSFCYPLKIYLRNCWHNNINHAIIQSIAERIPQQAINLGEPNGYQSTQYQRFAR